MAGSGQHAPFDSVGREGKAVAENEVGFKRFEGFIHEGAHETPELILRGQDAILPRAGKSSIAAVQRNFCAAAPAQFRRTARVVAVAVSQKNQSNLV